VSDGQGGTSAGKLTPNWPRDLLPREPGMVKNSDDLDDMLDDVSDKASIAPLDVAAVPLNAEYVFAKGAERSKLLGRKVKEPSPPEDAVNSRSCPSASVYVRYMELSDGKEVLFLPRRSKFAKGLDRVNLPGFGTGCPGRLSFRI
jgi:hypothetical protein